jgi:PAS domain S-box-containing protein
MGRFHESALPTAGSNENVAEATGDRQGSRPDDFVFRAAEAPTSAGNEANRFTIVIADLAKSRIGLGALLKALPIAGYVTDVHGFITFYNDAAVDLWGRTPEKGVTRWCGSLRLYSPDGLPMPHDESPLAVCLAEGRSNCGREVIAERPDGARVCFVNYATPIEDPNGRSIGALNMLTDNSERSRSNIEAARLAAIVDGSDDAIVGKNLDGIVTSWNGSAARIFGFSAEEMVGQSIMRIIPDDLQDEERAIIARLTRGERLDHFDTVRLARDGRRVDVSLTVSPLRDAAGNVVGSSKVARDVTERKRVEQALLDATVEAERANRAKTEFLAVMSHEIRTPLNCISGFTDLLATTTQLTPQQRRYTDLVRTANKALLAIVDDILDFSKVEAGQLELERHPFSLSGLIRDTVAIVSPMAAVKNLRVNITIEPGAPETIVGDHSRLRQILLNLLNNAVKFTVKGSITVDVRKQTGKDDRDCIRFSVTDSGIGIPAEQQHRLFERFSQADSSVSRKHGGSGLGLAICKQLVELMGGEIGIASEVGRGSTIWFYAHLPQMTQPTAEPEIMSRFENRAATKARILVVDDIETNLEIVEAYLKDREYRVECAGSGIEAIQMLGSRHYDLILMDVQMPVMDGVAATRRIRALPPPIRDIPIIAMTGNVLPQQVRSFLEAGMNDHIGKPIERVKLYNNLLRWLPEKRGSEPNRNSPAPVLDTDKFDEFLLLMGDKNAERIVEKFLMSLCDAFQSTPLESQREAHALINAAGVLGLERLVEACRSAEELLPSQDPDGARAVTSELLRAQAMARQMLTTQLLPKLRAKPRSARSLVQAVDNLEVALIDLENAASDFSRGQTSFSAPLERADLEALLPKISAANRMVQLALDGFGARSH